MLAGIRPPLVCLSARTSPRNASPNLPSWPRPTSPARLPAMRRETAGTIAASVSPAMFCSCWKLRTERSRNSSAAATVSPSNPAASAAASR